MKNIAIFGSTGSIGTQSLDVARENGYKVSVLTANKNVDIIEKQAREFLPKLVVMRDEVCAKELKNRLSDTDIKVLCGENGIIEAAALGEADIAINALVGIAGLDPTLAIIESGSTLALANKESLVCAGSIVMDAIKKKNVEILPVDSEHSAIFQCLVGHNKSDIKKILLTASGGPFFGRKLEDLRGMRAEDALKHPKWSMGSKITIDSSTMMNKGFEVIEALWLFGVKSNQIEVVVHPESIVHSMVEFEDNCVMAQMSLPDMRLPIQYALTYPARKKASWPALDLKKIGKLNFFEPDRESFPALELCEKAGEMGGNQGAIINGANEIAVEAFLNGKIGYTDIYDVVKDTVKHIDFTKISEINEVFAFDIKARDYAAACIKSID